MPLPLCPKIMVIRHGEKPNGIDAGVSLTGTHDETSLSVKGWQRAGALVHVFAPPHNLPLHPALSIPQFLFASVSSSQRPVQTILPLSEKLKLPIHEGRRNEEAQLVEQITACDGPTLVSWQREQIPALASILLKNSPDASQAPKFWSQNRFDVTWVFDLQTDIYRFTQVPQCLLAGDIESLIGVS